MPHNPHANFTPSLEGYTGQGAFRFWCQMALPLTYDDSLSYYELLNKVVTYLNNTISDVANVETNVGRLADAYNQLQSYVNDYFDNIDIEAELRTVLDKMALDGTLDDLLSPIVEQQLPGVVENQIDGVVENQIGGAVADQIDGVVAEQLPPLVDEGIPSEVTDWLNDNVTPVGGAVVVDSSLTIEGAAADAKKTGDELSDLKNALDDIGVTDNIVTVSAPETVAKTINGSGAIVDAAGNYHIYTASVTAGEIYFVTASNNWSAPLYAYYDSGMNLVQIGTTSEQGSSVTTINNERTVAPANAVYLVTTSLNELINYPIYMEGGYKLQRLDDVISDVNNLMEGITIRNLFNPSKVVSGYYFNGSNALVQNENSEYIDDYIQINNAYSYMANADYLQILTYDSNKTFIERKYNLEPFGTEMSFDNNVAFIRISRYGHSFPDNFIISESIAYDILTESNSNIFTATKTETSLAVSIGKLKIIVNKYNDSNIRAVNLWRTNDAYIKASDGTYKRLWYNSDSDGVVKISGEDDFIGGYHGDETQTAFKLMIDGIEYEESSIFTNLRFNEILLYCESNVYHCNTSELSETIAFERHKILVFNSNGYTVKNYWVAKENLLLTKAYMGMLSVERYTDSNYTDTMLNGYYSNYNYKFNSNFTPTGGQPYLTDVVFNTIYGDVGMHIDNIRSPGTYYGSIANYNSSYDKRLKAYFAAIDSNNGVQVNANNVITASATTYAH